MINLLKQIEKEKRDSGNGLVYTLFIKELIVDKGMDAKETAEKLRQLRESGLIKIGRTINDNYIKVIEQKTIEDNVY